MSRIKISLICLCLALLILVGGCSQPAKTQPDKENKGAEAVEKSDKENKASSEAIEISENIDIEGEEYKELTIQQKIEKLTAANDQIKSKNLVLKVLAKKEEYQMLASKVKNLPIMIAERDAIQNKMDKWYKDLDKYQIDKKDYMKFLSHSYEKELQAIAKKAKEEFQKENLETQLNFLETENRNLNSSSWKDTAKEMTKSEQERLEKKYDKSIKEIKEKLPIIIESSDKTKLLFLRYELMEKIDNEKEVKKFKKLKSEGKLK